ncbi:MAG TPA: M12 family metallo-peptidase, partial [Thermoplasmata archaeon]|nr:M12 family metallo-peptidase [Thermoplasmata archaeon]
VHADGGIYLALDGDGWNIRIGPAAGRTEIGVEGETTTYRILKRSREAPTLSAASEMVILPPESAQDLKTAESSVPTSYRVLRVLLVVTEGFWMAHQSDWQQFVTDRINVINTWIRPSAGITVYVTSWTNWPGVYVTCSTDGNALLQAFMNWIQTNQYLNGIVRDVAHLITESTTDCYNSNAAYGRAYEPGSYGYTSFEGSDWLKMERVLAHELGHNMNADHIQSQQSGLWDYTLMSASHTLNYYSDGSLDASNNNAQRIRAYAALKLPIVVHTYGASATTTDGLRLNYFDLYTASTPLVTGGAASSNVVTSKFSVTNTNQFGLNFCPAGVHTIGRNAANANRDFGWYLGSGSLGAGLTFYYEASRTFDGAGQWTLSPGYQLKVGGTGGDRCYWRSWGVQLFPFAYFLVQKTNGGGGPCAFDGWYTDSGAGADLQLRRFRLYSTSTNPRTGDTMWAEMILFNMRTTSTYVFPSPGPFVYGRTAAGGYQDFPGTGALTLSPFDSDGQWGSYGGGSSYFKNRPLTSSGALDFWPGFYNGAYGGFANEKCSITVL